MQSRKHVYRNLHVAVTVMIAGVSTESFAQSPDVSVGGTLLSMLVPLVLVVAAMLGALVLVRRRYGLTSSDGPMRIRQILAVGPRERLLLVEAEGRRLVVGVTGTTVNCVAILNDSVVAAGGVDPKKS